MFSLKSKESSKILTQRALKKLSFVQDREKLLVQEVETITRNLFYSQQDLLDAHEQTKDILNSISEGLCLIDEDFIIKEQHSNAIKDMLLIDAVAGKNILNILRKYLTEKKVLEVSDYLNLMYRKDIDQETLDELNPMTNLEISITQPNGKKDLRYLSFSSKRVLKDGAIESLMLRIQDITKQELLRNEMQKVEENKKLLIGLMHDIISSKPALISDFIKSAEDVFVKTNSILKSPVLEHDSIQDKLKEIAKLIHKIKGSALAVNMNLIADDLHSFENELENVSTNPSTNGEDLMPLVFKVKYLIERLQDVKNLISKFKEFNQGIWDKKERSDETKPQHTDDAWDSLKDSTMNLINKLNLRYKKSVSIAYHFSGQVSSEMIKSIESISIQMIRNSYAHAFKDNELERIARGKEKFPKISLSLQVENGKLIYSYLDDGKGLNVNDITHTLKTKYNMSDLEIDMMDNKERIRKIFDSNFSTSSEIDNISGRGVGLSLVADEAKRFQGKIRLAFKTNYYFKCNIEFPLNNMRATA